MSILAIPLQAAPPGGAGQGAAMLSSWLVPMALIIVVYYFLLVAPARRKQRAHREMLDALRPGDRILTSGGLIGTIVKVVKEEEMLRLRIAPSVEIDLSRGAVTSVLSEPQAGTKS